MEAFGYVRLSRLDRETTSPARQREVIEQMCSQRGWQLREVFEDLDVSGGKESRPGLDKMLSRLGEVGIIVTWKLDRLARSLSHLLKLAEAFEQAGVQLVTSDGEVDTTSAGGKAFFQMRGVFAEFERNTVSERSKGMHAYLKAEGRVQSRVPFGWQKGEGGRLQPVPEEQVTIRQMAAAYVKGKSLRELSREFGFEHTTIRSMLRSERVLSSLPTGLGNALATVLRLRSEGAGRARATSLLGGIALCGTCGEPLRKGKRAHGPVYACKAHGHVYVDEAWLDEDASRYLLRLLGEHQVTPRKHKPRQVNGNGRQALEARLEALEVDYYERGLISEASFLKRRAALVDKLAAIAQEREQASGDTTVEWQRWDELSLPEKRQAWLETGIRPIVDPLPEGSARGRHQGERVRLLIP